MTLDHVRRVAQRLQIPWRKVVQKARRTVLGILSVGLALLIADKWTPPLSEWCVYALLVYGGYCVAGDLVRGFFVWVPAALKDVAEGVRAIRDALKGSGPS